MSNASAQIIDTSGEDTALRALAGDLALVREKIETAFLDVGGRLGQCAGILTRISSSFEALPKDLESEEMAEASRRLDAIAQRAADMATSFAAEQDNIGRLVSVVSTAHRPIGELNRTVKMMGIVAINARVVAAGIVDEMDDFDVFTTDIADLSAKATDTIKEFAQVYRRLSDAVQRADAQRSQFEATHKDTLAQLAVSLRGHLDNVTQYRTRSAESGAETGRLSRQIANRIATAVSALQVGDTTRQRVEHVEAGLLAISDLTIGNRPAKLDPDVALDPALLPDLSAAICRLEAAQLADATQSYNHELVEAVDALHELARDAGQVIATSRAVYGEDEAGAGQSVLSGLTKDLMHASAVLRDCETERGKLDAVAVEVADTVRILLENVERVQEIEHNMRLVSLNAAVKCAQLGPKGRALDVIAGQLRTLTGETVTSAETAMERLREAAELAQAFTSASAGDAARQIAQLEDEARASVDLLNAVVERVGTALTALGIDGPKAVALLDAAAAGFSGHDAIAGAFATIQTRIADHGETMPSDGDTHIATSEGLPAALVAMLRKTYTMESERQLHDRLVGRVATAAPVAAAADDFEMFSSDDDVDLFGADDDGLELFGEPEPVAAETPAEAPVGEKDEDLDALFF